MNDNQNPQNPSPVTPGKILDVGAIVTMDEEVMKHGVLFVHPGLPPFRLLFTVEGGQLKHAFEVVGDAPAQPVKEATVIVPQQPKIIMPGGNA